MRTHNMIKKLKFNCLPNVVNRERHSVEKYHRFNANVFQIPDDYLGRKTNTSFMSPIKLHKRISFISSSLLHLSVRTVQSAGHFVVHLSPKVTILLFHPALLAQLVECTSLDYAGKFSVHISRGFKKNW